MTKVQKTRPIADRDRQEALHRMQRKYFRGVVLDTELGVADESKIDGLPDSAFVGERVRSFVAVSSWFWYCYPCGEPNQGGESDSREDK
jgi:hypothetical protein